jgi:acetylornithine deacetylase
MIRKLVSFDTTSRNSNLALIDYVRDYLAGHGIEAEYVHDESGKKANLYATLGPADRGGLMLSGHTDVVPIDGQDWRSDPWTIVERDGRLYGRGACDMKSFVAVALAMVPEFKRQTLARPIHFAFSYDEEVGCLGVRRLIDALGRRKVRPFACIVGEPSNMKPVRAHKGKISYRVRVRGFEAHSSLAPRGVNAVEYAARLIVKITEIGQRLAEQGPLDEEFDIPFTTTHTGVIAGGTALNIVPLDCAFEFEFRHLPEHDPFVLLEEVKRYAFDALLPQMRKIRPEAEIVFEEMSQIIGLNTSESAEIVQLAKAASGANSSGKVAYGTEAGAFEQSGIPTVICGPGDIDQAHKPNEFVALDQVALCETFLRRAVERACVAR